MADHMFAGLPTGNQNIWSESEIQKSDQNQKSKYLRKWEIQISEKIWYSNIWSESEIPIFEKTLLTPQCDFICICDHPLRINVYLLMHIFSHFICICVNRCIICGRGASIHMLWFYSFLVLMLFTTSADHRSSFSKIIKINHSSCSPLPKPHLVTLKNHFLQPWSNFGPKFRGRKKWSLEINVLVGGSKIWSGRS